MTDTTPQIQLRPIDPPSDLPIFFEQQRDPQANYMAAFTAKDPENRAAFDEHWEKVLASPSVTIRTIIYEGKVAGSVLVHGWFGDPEISYWLGREFWGKGIATQALALLLEQITIRPLYARVAQDNIASLKVLQKNGFVITGEDSGFANARSAETKEYVLSLK